MFSLLFCPHCVWRKKYIKVFTGLRREFLSCISFWYDFFRFYWPNIAEKIKEKKVKYTHTLKFSENNKSMNWIFHLKVFRPRTMAETNWNQNELFAERRIRRCDVLFSWTLCVCVCASYLVSFSCSSTKSIQKACLRYNVIYLYIWNRKWIHILLCQLKILWFVTFFLSFYT